MTNEASMLQQRNQCIIFSYDLLVYRRLFQSPTIESKPQKLDYRGPGRLHTTIVLAPMACSYTAIMELIMGSLKW